jgi:hypothetical protein
MPLWATPWAIAGFGHVAPLALPPQLVHIPGRPAFKFGVILCFPGGLLTFKKAQQLAALHFLARRFQQEGAAPAGTDQIVDLPQQIARNQYVCSLCTFHMCT